MSINYTRIIAIGTAVLAGATIGSFQNRIEDHKFTSEQINDYHVHMMSPKLFNIMNQKWQQSSEPMKLQPNLNATELIKYMTQNNINKSLLVSSAYLYTSHMMQYLELSTTKEQEYVEAENDYIYTQSQLYPNKLIPSFSIHPFKLYSLSEAARCLKLEGNKVCKLHFSNSNVNFQENPDGISKIQELFDLVQDKNGMILLHFDNCFMEDAEFGGIREYVDNFMHECVVPFDRLKIIFAHLGGFGGFDARTADIFEAILDAVIKYDMKDRIYFDISSIFFKERPVDIVPAFEERERFAELIKRMEDNEMLRQLIYGSDYPFVKHNEYLECMRELWPEQLSVLDDILCNEIPIVINDDTKRQNFKLRKQ